MGRFHPTEAKTYAAPIGGGIGFGLGQALLWLLGVTVWGADKSAIHNDAAIAAVPAVWTYVVGYGMTGLVAFAASWLAPHTSRTPAARVPRPAPVAPAAPVPAVAPAAPVDQPTAQLWQREQWAREEQVAERARQAWPPSENFGLPTPQDPPQAEPDTSLTDYLLDENPTAAGSTGLPEGAAGA